MRGYTIEKSIDLLEKDVRELKATGAGGTRADLVSFNNQGSTLQATNVQEALRELDDNVSANVESIEDLEIDVQNISNDLDTSSFDLTYVATFSFNDVLAKRSGKIVSISGKITLPSDLSTNTRVLTSPYYPVDNLKFVPLRKTFSPYAPVASSGFIRGTNGSLELPKGLTAGSYYFDVVYITN